MKKLKPTDPRGGSRLDRLCPDDLRPGTFALVFMSPANKVKMEMKPESSAENSAIKGVGTCVGGSVCWVCQVVPSTVSRKCLEGWRLDWGILCTSQDSRDRHYPTRRAVPSLHHSHREPSCLVKLAKPTF